VFLLHAIVLLSAALLFAAPQKSLPDRASLLAVVKYRPNGTLISVPVRVDSSRVLWFVLDSGARRTIVDRAVARGLGLKSLAVSRGSGVGHGTFRQDRSEPIVISIGAVSMPVSEPWLIDLQHVGTKQREDGLLGADLFERYVIRIDPIAHTIAFYDPKKFTYVGTGATVSLASPHDRLYTEMILTIGSKSVHRRMRVDTGSEDAASDNLVRQSPTRRRSLQGIGLGTPYYDYSGVFDSVRIGPYSIRHSWGASNDHPAFGMEIMRRFTLTFDAPGKRLYLEPNQHLNEPVPSPL